MRLIRATYLDGVQRQAPLKRFEPACARRYDVINSARADNMASERVPHT